MTWLQHYRLSSFLRSSIGLPAVLGMAAALLLLPLIRRVDLILGWEAVVGPDSARALLGALAASMLTFIVFVFSILLLAVQLASAQLTPRIISLVYRSRVIKISLTFFVFAFTYALTALSRIGDAVPQISLWLGVYSCLLSIALFLYMIDRVGKSLRPVSVLTRLGDIGQGVLRQVYPRRLAASDEIPAQ